MLTCHALISQSTLQLSSVFVHPVRLYCGVTNGCQLHSCTHHIHRTGILDTTVYMTSTMKTVNLKAFKVTGYSCVHSHEVQCTPEEYADFGTKNKIMGLESHQVNTSSRAHKGHDGSFSDSIVCCKVSCCLTAKLMPLFCFWAAIQRIRKSFCQALKFPAAHFKHQNQAVDVLCI